MEIAYAKISYFIKIGPRLLAMSMSTVVSESAFSTKGRIIDDFIASLTPKMAQALICCQDWLRRAPFKPVEEHYDAIDKILLSYSCRCCIKCGLEVNHYRVMILCITEILSDSQDFQVSRL
ncbi:UNVERIFIED_CONTAM: hypothetical protein Sradi_3584000 [Sesamum radiatum]|uniref:HAT C-terminal dimerisation domain-containing protein n=1 Tax=Sesamum radiatum TaxID=300843 RepID=A0AAW2QGW5_SESRA